MLRRFNKYIKMKNLFLLFSLFIAVQLTFAQHHKCSRAGNSITNTTHPQADTINVVDYNINLNITDFTNKIISGYTVVKLTPKQNNISTIKLDLLSLNVDSVKIDNVISTFTYNDTLLAITSATALNTDDTVDVIVYYYGNPITDPSGWGGFYFSGNTAYNLGVGFNDAPHNYGRVWFPCIDDFIDRAFYSFNITVPDNLTAVCNGTLENTVDNANGTKTFSWVLHNHIPTYLASVAVSDYVAVEGTYNGINGAIPTSIYVAPGQQSNATASFINLNPTLNSFEQHFGAYKWERVGYVAVPFNSGAMEHATNIAYPAAVINGSLSYETLWAHELSHHWFGDLATCRTPEDMWLNEGWAAYSESIFKENIYDDAAFKMYVRKNHYSVLHSAHTDDGGYYAVAGIPHNITYGSTVYDKGADMVHTLRYYLGNEKFFSGVQQYLSDFSYKDASSEDLRDNLSASSGIDLTDFFDSWIFLKGFSQFDIDSFNVAQNGTDYDVTVYVRQKLREKPSFANSNRIPVSFMKADWTYLDTVVTFSGEYGNQTFTIPFNPYNVWIDRNIEVMGASVKQEEVYKTTGYYSLNQIGVNLQVTNITDSAKLRFVHNWVLPDEFYNPITDLNISTSHYWRVDGYLPNDFICRTKFNYKIADLDGDLNIVEEDSLVLLYRENRKVDWQIESNNVHGNQYDGYIQVDTVKVGEYCFAIWNRPLSVNETKNNDRTEIINIYPNPANNNLQIVIADEKLLNKEATVHSVNGTKVKEFKIDNLQTELNIQDLQAGNYIIKIGTISKAFIKK